MLSKNPWIKRLTLYLMEAFGLAIFMMSACFFGAMLEGLNTTWHHALPDATLRLILMAVAMGSTALFIFYSPFTAPSGSHINPAVTLAFLQIKRINKTDAFFYIIFQLFGGTLAVYVMTYFMGATLTNPPVNFVVTIPQKGVFLAIFTEFTTAFLMMSMVLWVSSNHKYSQYSRLFSAILVVCYVIIAGPFSGFGMNPARTFASAFPSGIYTNFWLYILMPIAGMQFAAALFSYFSKHKIHLKTKFDYHW